MTTISHWPAILWDAIILTPYFTANFIRLPFIITANHVSTSFTAVLPSVCDRLYYMLNVQLFLRLQLTPHTVTLSLLSYMFEDPKFLRPQLEPRARHIKLISTTEAVPYACVIQWNILNGHLFLPPQFVPNKTHCNVSVEIGLRLDSPKRRDSHSVLNVGKYPLSCKQKKIYCLTR